MHKNENHVREPLFHIVKRAALPGWQSAAIRVLAVLISLIVCGIIIVLFTGENPINVYATMIKGAVGTNRRLWNLLQSVAILLCISLAVTPAFRMRFWNTGAEGQALIGGLATAACMIFFGGKMPTALLLIVTVVASVVAGAVWGLIPALFKAYWGTNETLFTLMMNYVAIQIVSFFTYRFSVPKGSGQIGIINRDTRAGWLPVIGNNYLLNILIVVVLTILIYIYLNYSKHGYEISVVGHRCQEGHHPDHADLGCDLRPGGPSAGRRYGPHDHPRHDRGARLYRDHGELDGEIQPDLHDHHVVPDLLHVEGIRGDRDGLRVQRFVRGHYHGHYHFLHHRQ